MLSTEQTLSIVAISVAGVSLVWTGGLAVRLWAARRAVAALQGRRKMADDPDALASLEGELDRLEDAIARSVQCVGVVRFDAFEDMGGQLSFSAALLDGQGKGLVLTSINGRRETRIYAKPIEGGASRFNLSDEEKEAIRRALAPDAS
jgi:hypothetical protein